MMNILKFLHCFEGYMKRMTFVFLTGALVLNGMFLGCASHDDAHATAQNGAYAGGNGVFGENPANPGEHSGQRFREASADIPKAPSADPSTTH